MSRARAYNQDTLDVMARYFEVMNELADAKKLPGGISGYCSTYGIDKRHWYAQRANPGRGYFEIAWVIPLIKYFKVSANWMLLGTGKKYRGSTSSTPI